MHSLYIQEYNRIINEWRVVLILVVVLRKKYLIAFSLGFLLFASTAWGLSLYEPKAVATVSSANNNWGLSFSESGKPPTGNATAEFLKNYNAYFIGDTSDKKIYLTFDAGFENGYTPTILDVLKKNDVKATFFIVGNYIQSSPELVKRMVEEGHTVGNHTFSHPDMSKISQLESFKKELISLEELYKEVTGQDMIKFYRPPQGKYSEENLKQANELGYKTFFWSLAYVDWLKDKQPSKEYAFEKLSRIHDGAIILLHSTSKTNCDILDELINKWKNDGYQFSDLRDLVESN